MDEYEIDDLERQLLAGRTQNAPLELRAAVLSGMHRELTAGKWDRRLTRLTTLLLMLGLGTNAAISLPFAQSTGGSRERMVSAKSRALLIETAVNVAETTDTLAGNRFAFYLADMVGWTLTEEERGAIQAEILRSVRQSRTNGSDG